MTKNPGKAVLEDLYTDQRMTMREIGLRYGVTRVAVRKWLVAEEIPLLPYESKGKPKSPAHAAALAENLKKARANAFTESALKKRSDAMRGRTPGNKGQPWTTTQREKLTAIRKTDEHREKLSESKRGARNGMWRDGASKMPHDLRTQAWKRARNACYARDNWTCQDCGVKCGRSGTSRIQAHHIIPRRLGGGHELENLVTLCVSCHTTREAKFAGALIV